MRVWTKAAALDALRREAQRIGKTPGARDLWARDRVCPSLNVYRRLCGGLLPAQQAAGLPANYRGARVGWRKKRCHKGHLRTPDNLDSRGHCLVCAEHWKTPRRAKQRRPPALSSSQAQHITRAKQTYWANGGTDWVHPYARRSA